MKIRVTAAVLAALLAAGTVSACGSTDPVVKEKENKTYLTELPEIKDGEYPEKFDLRDYGYVTPVKLQNPFGYCWAFGAVGAAETSILSELGKNCDEYPLDLSEHHLAWFVKNHIPAEGEDGYDSADSQSGEGYYTESWTSDSWAESGEPAYAIAAFAAGVGAASEETAPYQGKNGKIMYLTRQGKLSYSASIFGSTKYCYSSEDDWSLDESIRYERLYDLEAGLRLPALAAEGDTLNTEGINAVKEMLVEGRGVEIAFMADDASPDASGRNTVSRYLNGETWAHYTFDTTNTNHCVEIVGWDDTYSRENFKSDKAVQWDENGDPLTDGSGNYVYEDEDAPLPAGDGAWIVKNSWGADTENFPNNSEWGVDGTGYFYISYYDQSISEPTAFDFDTENEGGSYSITQQYDLLLAAGSLPHEEQQKVMEANVFEAEEDMKLEAVGAWCAEKDMTVTYEIYLLDSGAEDPEDGTKAASFEKTYSYAGYYREKLENPVELKKGQRYAVVLTQYQDSEKNYYYQYTENGNGKDSILAMFSHSYYVSTVNPGESFICFEKTGWQDLADYIKAQNGEGDQTNADDNFCIKAFGNPS